MSKKTNISAIAMAKRTGGLMFQLTADDVRRLHPAWSDSEAERFLQLHTDEIGNVVMTMALAGLTRLIAHYVETRDDC